MADTIIFYDRTGAAIAYTLADGETLYTYTGRAVGYLHEDGLYDFQGRMLAWYLDGWMVDSNGARLFFTKYSKNGPNTPVKGIPPVQGIRQFCPSRDRRSEKGLRPAFSLQWSPRSGEAFFGKPPAPTMVRSSAKPKRGELTPVQDLDIMDVMSMLGVTPAPAAPTETEAEPAVPDEAPEAPEAAAAHAVNAALVVEAAVVLKAVELAAIVEPLAPHEAERQPSPAPPVEANPPLQE